MLPLATANETRSIDRRSMESYGIPGVVLMENAGRGVFELMLENFPDLTNKKVVVVAGKGNNGGDGFVIARHLFNSGVSVEVRLLGKLDQLKNEARTHADIAVRSGVPVHETDNGNLNARNHSLRHCHIIVDAIFGTGLTKPAGGIHEKMIKKINTSGKPVVAVDLPSGLDSDTGHIIGPHVKAHITAALAVLKRSHVLYPAADSMGEVRLVPIGIPPSAVSEENLSVHLLEESDLKPWFPRRPKNTHKGYFGHTLVVAGSRGKVGAAGLTALGALRAGAGLVTLALPESCQKALDKIPLEVMTVPLPETPKGFLSTAALETLMVHLKDKNAVALGPGISTREETADLLEQWLPRIRCPLVIDADGVNCLAKRPGLIARLNTPTALTPHPKEMSRLSGWSVAEILANRLGHTAQYSQENNVTMVLKGAHSIIAFPDGETWVNPTGNPGMATAGSGDVLTGMIAGLISQGLEMKQATAAGVYLHGLAGDLYADANSETTLIAGDLLRTLPDAFKRIVP